MRGRKTRPPEAERPSASDRKRRPLGIMALEPRIMFDAAAATTAAAADNHDSASNSAGLAAVSQAEHAPRPAPPVPDASPQAATSTTPANSSAPANDASSIATPATDTSAPAPVHEIVIIDSTVPGIGDLINGVKPGDKVFVLDANKDGVQQIADIIRDNNLHDLSAIQIVSHGNEGEISLGSTKLTAANLADHSAALAAIGQALTADGDILLYGCDVASGAGGQLLNGLATYTGADVAGSTDTTGAAALGGNWTLEASTGAIESTLPFTEAAVAHYAYALDPPSVTTGAVLDYTENDAATPIATDLTVADIDSANLTSAAVQITGNYVNGQDVLGFVDTANITGTFDASTGTLTLTGTDTVANYQAALRAVTYVNGSDNPSTNSRTVMFTVNDGTSDSNAATATVNLTAENDAPVVTAGNTLNYIENQAAVSITPALALSDADSADLTGATVQITGNYVRSQDFLFFTNTGNITGSFDALTGTLTLSGTDTVAHYQSALQSVRYLNSSDNPSTAARTVTYTVNDGTANSTAATSTINVTAVNDAPVIVAGGSISYLENQAGTVVNSTIVLSDADSGNLTGATVQITGGFDVGKDTLTFLNVGNISGSFNPADGTLTATGTDTRNNYQAFLRSIKFQNSSDNPSTAQRTITWTVKDDANAVSNAATSTIDVTAVNDAPSGVTKLITTDEDTPYTFTTADFGFTDFFDNNNFLAVKITTVPVAGTLTNNGVSIAAGSFVSAADIAASKLVFTPGLNASGVGYASFQFQVQDDGGTANSGKDLDPTPKLIAFTVNAVNDAPAFTSGSAVSVPEGTSTLTVVYIATTTDPDGAAPTYSLTGADANLFNINSTTGAVTFKAIPNFESPADAGSDNVYNITVQAFDGTDTTNQAVAITVTDVAPAITSGNSVSVNEGVSTSAVIYSVTATDVAGGTLTYSLSGTDAGAFNINSSTGAVTFKNSPDFETKASYSFDVEASDGTLSSAKTFTVSVNDLAPTITSPSSVSVNEGVPAGSVVYTAVAADPAGGTLTYTITGADAARFTIDSSTGVVTINNAPDFESKASYNFTVQASDPSGLFSIRAVTLNVNDLPPAISSGATATVAENVAPGTIVYTAVAADPAGGAVTYSISGADAAALSIDALTGVVTINSSPNFEAKTSYNFTVRASDSSLLSSTQAVTLSVTNIDEAPTLTATGVNPIYTENGAAADLFSSVSASTIDAGQNLDQLTLTVSSVTNGSAEVLRIDGSDVVLTDGTSVTTAANGLTASVSVVGTTATVTLSKSLGVPASTLAGVIDGMAYRNDSEVPTAGFRTVTLTSLRDTGANGGADRNETPLGVVSFVNVVAVNDAPVLTGLDATGPTVIERGAAVIIDSNVTVSDFELDALNGGSGDYSGATLTVTRNGGANINDVFGIVSGGAFTATSANLQFNNLTFATFTTSGGVLTINFIDNPPAIATTALVNDVLQHITYASTDHNPLAPVQVDYTFQDGNAGSQGGGGDKTVVASTAISITPVNDAPAGADNTVTTLEDTVYKFTASDFGFSDVDGGALAAVIIDSVPVNGVLKNGGLVVTAGQSVAAADIALGRLTYTPVADANGDGLASLTFRLQDNGGTANGGVDTEATAHTITVNVTPVNDAPAGADKTITLNEDSTYTFGAADFGFSDAHDSPANGLDAVVFTTLPGAGTLRLDGIALTAGATVLRSDLGRLTYIPGPNGNGALYATFTFQVRDNGGAANGGVNLDQTPNTITFDVTPINDAPGAFIPGGYSATEQVSLSLKNTGMFVADTDSAGGIETVTLSVTEGTLTVTAGTSGAAVANSGTSSVTISGTLAQINALLNTDASSSVSYINNSDTPAASATLTMSINDNGNSGIGGALTRTATAAINITAVNDAPVLSVPGALAVGQNGAQIVSGISIADPDVGSTVMQFTLIASHGTLTFASTTGLFFVGDTNGGSNVLVLATRAALNAALSGNNLVYMPTGGYAGADTIELYISDLGGTGTGGDKITQGTIAVSVGGVNATQTITLANDVDGDGVADPGDTVTVTVTATNGTGTTVTNMSFDEFLNGLTQTGNVNISPLALDDSYTAIGNTQLIVNATGTNPGIMPAYVVQQVGGLFANDREFLGDTFSLKSVTGNAGGINFVNGFVTTTTLHGTITINADGTFVYAANAGYAGTDSLTYTITDGGLDGNVATTADNLTGTGKVTITVSNMVWYVDGANGNDATGTGTSTNPFKTINASNLGGANGVGDVDGAGDTIYVQNTASGSLPLEANQRLIGTGSALQVGLVTLVSAGTNSTLQASGGSAVTLGTGNTIQGIDIANSNGTGITGTGFGTLNVDKVSVSAINGAALDLTNGAFGSGANFTSLSSSGALHNVSLAGVTGSVDLGGGSLSNATGSSFDVNGGSVSATYSGSISQANNAALVNVTNGHTGTLTFNTSTLSATNGTGFQFSNADGTYNFNGTNNLNGGDAGIDILNGSDGTFNFQAADSSSNTFINNPTGTAFNLAGGGRATVNYSGDIIANNGRAVVVDGHTGNTITFLTGSITGSGPDASGILIQNNTGGLVTFRNENVTLSTRANNGVTLLNNTGAAISFKPDSGFANGLDIATTSGTGFLASGGGTITVFSPTDTITTATGKLLDLSNVTIGSAMQFVSLVATGSVAGTAISFNNVDNGSFAGNLVSIAGTTGAQSDGIFIGGGSSAIIQFASVTINNTGRHAFNIDGAGLSTIIVTSATIGNAVAGTGVAGNGINISGTDNSISFGNGTIGTGNDPAGSGIVINGGSGNITINAAVTKTTAGKIVDIQNRTGGTISAVVALSATGGVDNGINVSGNTGGTIQFSSTSKVLSTGANTAVNLANNTGATIDFLNSNLVITTTSGTGFNATGGGTISVRGIGNTITSTTGTALNVANTTIGGNGLTFQSISSNGAASGIVLNNTGASGGLTVTGIGTVNSGGTINASTGAGISLTNTNNVSLTRMLIQNGLDDGIRASAVNNFSISNSTVTANGNAASEYGADFSNVTGTVRFTSSTFSLNRDDQVHYVNDTGGADIEFNGVTVTGTGVASALGNGILVTASSAANVDVRVISGTFNNFFGNSFQARNEGTGTLEATVANSTFDNTGNNAINITQNAAGTTRFSIHDNTRFLRGSNTANNAAVISILQDTAAPAGALLEGRINNNTIGDNTSVNSGTGANYGVSVVSRAPGTTTVQIDHNNIQGTGGGILVQMGENTNSSHTMNATINDNTVVQTSGLAVNGIRVNIGVTTNDAGVARIDMYNNNSTMSGAAAANFGNAISVSSRFLTSIQMPGYAGGNKAFSAVQSYLDNTKANNATGGLGWDISASSTSGGFLNTSGGSAIPLPTLPSPLLLAADGVDAAPQEPTETVQEPETPVEQGASDPGTSNPGTPDSGEQTASPAQPPADTNTPPSNTATTTQPIFVDDGVLSQAELNALVAQAIANWEATGLTAEQAAYLRSVTFSISNLGGIKIGTATAGHVTLDDDGAGLGWFIDSTPGDSSEFPNAQAPTRALTNSTLAPAGKIDLLTAIEHELGHQLGLSDSYATADRNSLMFGYLAAGERRAPTMGEAEGSTPGSITSVDTLLAPVSVGDLPLGKTITIQFQATVNAQNPGLIVNPTNSGTFTYNGGTASTNTVTTVVDSLALGDRIFNDVNGDGVFQAGSESGIGGVALTLYTDANGNGVFDAGVDTPVATTTTAADGTYSFAGLAAGDYIVQVNESNFGTVLAGRTVTGSNADPDDNVDNDSNGAVVAGNGVVTKAITLAYNTEPTAGSGNDTNKTLDIGFTHVNLAPSGASKTVTTNEDVAYVFTAFDFGFSDSDANALVAVKIATVPGQGALTNNGVAVTAGQFVSVSDITSGKLRFTPVADANGSGYASFTFQVQDNGGTAAGGIDTDPTARTMTINVTPVNDAPVAVNDSYSATLDTTLNGSSVLANDSDVDAGSSLSVTAVNGSAAGVGNQITLASGAHLTLNANGTFTYIPATGYTGADSFTYQVSDGALTSTATVTVDVTSSPVVATADVYTTAEDTALHVAAGTGVLANDSDSNPARSIDPNSVVLISGVSHGTLTLNADGSFDYTPASNYNGTDSFTYRVSDSGGSIGTATVTITVTAVNDAPVNAVPIAQSVNEDVTLVFSAGNGNAISISDVDHNGGDETVTLTVNSGTLTLGTVANLTSVSGNGSNSVTLTGTVANINTALNGLAYLGILNSNGAETLTITTSDNGFTGAPGAQQDQDTVAITVNPVNDAPVVVTSGGTTAANEQVSVAIDGGITLSDVDDTAFVSAKVSITGNFQTGQDVLAFANTAGMGNIAGTYDTGTGVLTLTSSGGTATLAQWQAALRAVTYTNTSDTPVTGSRTVSFTVNDGDTDSAVATKDLSVTAINDAPTIQAPTGFSGTPGVAITIGGTGGDKIVFADADETGGIVHATFSTTQGTLAAASNGGVTVTGTATSRTLTGTIADINAYLAAGSLTYTSGLNDTLHVVVDDHGQTGAPGAQQATLDIPLSVDIPPVISGVAASATFTEDGGPITLSPAISLSDADAPLNAINKAVIQITDGRLGDVLDAASVPAGITASYDSATFTLTLSGSGTLASYEQALRSVRFGTPSNDPTAGGTDLNRSVSWTVYDNFDVPSTAATTTVAITAVNDAPVNAVPGAQTVFEDIDLVFSTANGNAITISDIDGGTGNETVTLSALHGVLTLTGPTAGLTSFTSGAASISLTGSIAQINAALAGLTYRGVSDYNGADTLTITTNDNGNTPSSPLQDVDTVAITISPVADTAADILATNEDTPITANVITGTNGASADNFEDSGRTLTGVTQGAHGSVTFAANGTITYTPNADYNGTDSFTYTVTSGGVTETGTVNVTIAPVADAVPDQLTTDEDTPLVFNPLTGTNGASADNFEDPNAAVTSVTQGTNGTVTLASDGTVTYTPNLNYYGPDSFTYTVTSGGVTETSTVDITVVPVNDAPVLNANAGVAYTEQGAPIVLSSGLTLSDVDSLNLSGAAVVITDGLDGDLLSIDTTGTSITAAYDASTRTLTLSGTDSRANYQQVLRSVSFASTSDNPTNYGANTGRSISWTITDADETSPALINESGTSTSTVSVTGVNDAPVLGNVPTTFSFIENTSLPLAPTLTLSDVDNENLAGATVKITAGGFVGAGDVLSADTSNTSISASYDSATGTLRLTGTDTLAHYQQVLRSVTFTSGDNPTNFGNTNPDRNVTWTIDDGQSSDNLSAVQPLTVSITPVNDAPVLVSGNTVIFDSALPDRLVLNPNIQLSDVDNQTLAGAAVTIVNGLNGDTLSAATAGTNIVATYNSGTKTLVLTGIDTIANYRQVLAGVTFGTTSPETAMRNVTWTVTDGAAASAAATTQVGVLEPLVPRSTPPSFGAGTNPDPTDRFQTPTFNGLITGFNNNGLNTGDFNRGAGIGIIFVQADLQILSSDRGLAFQISLAAFDSALPGQIATISATQTDGTPLPAWLRFDPATGTFTGELPAGKVANVQQAAPDADVETAAVDGTESISITITARDAAGNRATQTIIIKLSSPRTDLNLRDGATRFGWNSVTPFDGAQRYAGLLDQLDLAAIAAPSVAMDGGDGAVAAEVTVSGETIHAGRAGLSEQINGFGWRGMQTDRSALLASLQNRAGRTR